VNTVFPNQQDFKDSLVKNLKIPEGYTLTVAATALGKPRMMIGTKNGLYITRRYVGDVNNLPDGGQHDNRTIPFGPDNKLYITAGSNCN
jgi:glucose/arabinose dehydrogenase